MEITAQKFRLKLPHDTVHPFFLTTYHSPLTGLTLCWILFSSRLSLCLDSSVLSYISRRKQTANIAVIFPRGRTNIKSINTMMSFTKYLHFRLSYFFLEKIRQPNFIIRTKNNYYRVEQHNIIENYFRTNYVFRCNIAHFGRKKLNCTLLFFLAVVQL